MPPFQCFSSARYSAPLPDRHPFPMNKFIDSANRLVNEGTLLPEEIIDPGQVEEEDLLRVHTSEYVQSIANGNYYGVTKRKLGLPWSPELNIRSRTASSGTIQATEAAAKYGISCNLAGGTHHAFPDHGEGYCVFNDIAIAVKKLHFSSPSTKVLIVDLDAHQGNGTHFILGKEENVYTFSMHVGANYPSQKTAGTHDIELERYVDGNLYLEKLQQALPHILTQFEPARVFYIAGVDVHKDDRFGQMNLTTEEMALRDSFVISSVRQLKLPLVVVYGGGYNKNPDVTTELHCQTIRIAKNFAD